MDKIPLYQHLIYSLITSIGFAIYLSASKIDAIVSGIIGGLGWTLYMILLISTKEVIFPYFVATITIGVLGNICSKIWKKPTIVYVLPGIIPLVPGYTMYYTMLYIATAEYKLATSKGIEAIFIALAIASALVITESLRKITNKIMDSLEKKRKRLKLLKDTILK